MQKGDPAKFLARFRNLCQSHPRPLDEAMEGGIDGRHQQLVLILKVKIDGAVGYAGPAGDLSHARVEKAVLGDDFDGGIEDALVLVGSSIGRFSRGFGWPFHFEVSEFTWIWSRIQLRFLAPRRHTSRGIS